jgi:hypothetical protein
MSDGIKLAVRYLTPRTIFKRGCLLGNSSRRRCHDRRPDLYVVLCDSHIASIEGVAATSLRLAIIIPIAKLKPPKQIEVSKAIYEFAFVPLLFPAHLPYSNSIIPLLFLSPSPLFKQYHKFTSIPLLLLSPSPLFEAVT